MIENKQGRPNSDLLPTRSFLCLTCIYTGIVGSCENGFRVINKNKSINTDFWELLRN